MKNNCPIENAESQDSNVFPTRLRAKTILPAVIVMLVALILIPFADKTWRIIHHFVSAWLLEEFSYMGASLATLTVAMIAIIWRLDPKRRQALLVFLIALSISSCVNEVIKQVAGRARPRYTVNLGDKEREQIQQYSIEHPGAPIKAKKHDQWLLFKRHRPFFQYSYASFPSGHSNSAFVTAAFLALLYPGARVIWLVLAAGCALARVRDAAHFLEDVLFGGALGWLIAYWVFSMNWVARLAYRIIKIVSPRK